MKKLVLSLVAVAVFGVAASAQTYLTPKVGISLGKFGQENDDVEGGDTKIGIVGGVGLSIGIVEDFFAIAPELLFVQNGEQLEEDGVTASTSINYLQLPVLAKIMFGGDAAKFHVEAGPYVGYALSGKSKLEGDGGSLDFDTEFGDGEDQTRRLDFGAQFGVGVGIAAGPGLLGLDARYNLGLSNTNNLEGDDVGVFNRPILITVGYSIPFGN